jgi:phage shock protein E
MRKQFQEIHTFVFSKHMKFILYASIFTLFTACGNRHNKNVVHLSSKDLAKKLETTDDQVLLDVRTPEEFAEGHIPGAINMDYQSDDFAKQIQKLDTASQILVYCRSGKRSAKAADILMENGFRRVSNLENGILEWKSESRSIAKDSSNSTP